MLLLTKSALETCLTAARSAHPNEFLGLLTGRRLEKNDPLLRAKPTPAHEGDILIEGVVVPPGLRVNPNSAGYLPWMMPTSIDHWGIFHSHPSFSNRPSRADILSSSKEGGVSLIVCQPFRLEDLRAYDSAGRPIEFAIANAL